MGLACLLLHTAAVAQQADSTAKSSGLMAIPSKPGKEWYEKISLRGYAQVRYNRLFETNPQLKCEQCDRSWGENGGFFFRRIRLVFSGNVHERVYIYIQPDFASAPGSNTLNFAQIRDAYFDLALDKQKEFRLRIGQSKVPYGFENLQSSQNRIPLDRNDALNSAVANERDIGVMFYWAPSHIRERFAYLVSSGLKGSGDYGVVGLGAYNGQTANRPEANNSSHLVARVSYPFQLANGQFIEPGLQAYTGEFVINKSRGTEGPTQFREYRTAATMVVYPQPFGLQAEYNVGVGPEFDPAKKAVVEKPLHGGYVMASYMMKIGGQFLIPFARAQYYEGGKKFEIDARRHRVSEQEIGVEWQPFKNFELVAMYTFSDRTFEDLDNPVNRQRGRLLRLQVQFNY
jgi:phosphate-selective porin